MNRFSGPLAGFRSQLQIANPYDIEDLVEYKVELFGSNFHRLETFSVPEGHPSKRYLEYRSHDARIRGFTVAPDCLKLELNDYDGWRLAGAFEQRLGRPVSRSRLKPKVPVTLSFTGLRHWKVFQYEASGKLIRVKHSLKSNLSRMDEYVGDTVLQFNRSGISLILEARVSPCRMSLIEEGDLRTGVGNVWREYNLLLCIECMDITVQELQRQAWSDQFGEDTAWIWDEFTAVRDSRYMPGWQDFVDFVDEAISRKTRI